MLRLGSKTMLRYSNHSRRLRTQKHKDKTLKCSYVKSRKLIGDPPIWGSLYHTHSWRTQRAVMSSTFDPGGQSLVVPKALVKTNLLMWHATGVTKEPKISHGQMDSSNAPGKEIHWVLHPVCRVWGPWFPNQLDMTNGIEFLHSPLSWALTRSWTTDLVITNDVL